MKKLFESIGIEEFYASITDPQYIAEIYAKGLKEKNAILAITAQNELVKRGDVDLVITELKKAFDEKSFEVNTTFTQLVATSLIGIGRLDPFLRRIGKVLLSGTVEISEKERDELNEKSILTETLRKLILEHDYTDSEFYAMIDQVFEEIG